MIRDQNVQRRIDKMQLEIEQLRTELTRLREPAGMQLQTPRLARTVQHDDYPESTDPTGGLHGQFPIEFIDSGHNGEIGWRSFNAKKRQGTAEYSVVAAHAARGWIAPETVVCAFRQVPIDPAIPEEWFITPLGGGSGATISLGVLESTVGHHRVGRLKLTEQVGEVDVGDAAIVMWREPEEFMNVLNVTFSDLEAGSLSATIPSNEPMMFAITISEYTMPIVFPAQLEPCFLPTLQTVTT